MKIFIFCVISLLATSISTAEVPSNGYGTPVVAFPSLLRKQLGEDLYGDGDAELGDADFSSVIHDAQAALGKPSTTALNPPSKGEEEDADDISSRIETDNPKNTLSDITDTGESLESSEGRAGRRARGLRKRAKKTLKKLKKKLQKVAQRLPPIGVNVKMPL